MVLTSTTQKKVSTIHFHTLNLCNKGRLFFSKPVGKAYPLRIQCFQKHKFQDLFFSSMVLLLNLQINKTEDTECQHWYNFTIIQLFLNPVQSDRFSFSSLNVEVPSPVWEMPEDLGNGVWGMRGLGTRV